MTDPLIALELSFDDSRPAVAWVDLSGERIIYHAKSLDECAAFILLTHRELLLWAKDRKRYQA